MPLNKTLTAPHPPPQKRGASLGGAGLVGSRSFSYDRKSLKYRGAKGLELMVRDIGMHVHDVLGGWLGRVYEVLPRQGLP